tara:strand:+ start:117690 stop:118250 length:561 start_codon:yes stop_codon:yes gene_type:complete
MSLEQQTPKKESAGAPSNMDSNRRESGKHSDTKQYLTFMLAEELYGIDILKVQEIRGWSHATQIPNAPKFIRGVLNLRGSVVPILDVRRRFTMPEVEFTAQTVVIVVNVANRTIGMIVDSVSDVVDLPIDELRPAPDFGSSIDSSFIQGLSPNGDDMVILINVEDMLKGCDLVKVDELEKMVADVE